MILQHYGKSIDLLGIFFASGHIKIMGKLVSIIFHIIMLIRNIQYLPLNNP